MGNANNGKNLDERVHEGSGVYTGLGPKFEVDDKNKTFKLVKEGYFFNNLVETYYILKGYTMMK
jgi:hypothetical protein